MPACVRAAFKSITAPAQSWIAAPSKVNGSFVCTRRRLNVSLTRVRLCLHRRPLSGGGLQLEELWSCVVRVSARKTLSYRLNCIATKTQIDSKETYGCLSNKRCVRWQNVLQRVIKRSFGDPAARWIQLARFQPDVFRSKLLLTSVCAVTASQPWVIVCVAAQSAQWINFGGVAWCHADQRVTLRQIYAGGRLRSFPRLENTEANLLFRKNGLTDTK